jgi:hypothetical protein
VAPPALRGRATVGLEEPEVTGVRRWSKTLLIRTEELAFPRPGQRLSRSDSWWPVLGVHRGFTFGSNKRRRGRAPNRQERTEIQSLGI